MTTYYVRKSGSDANGGTDPNTDAWLTIDKAANTVAAADTVYIGAGVYRELVTMDTPGSSGSQISFIADVDGEQTGDAGLVIISAYADEISLAIRAACVDLNGHEFITWQGFSMVGGTTATILSSVAGNHPFEGMIIEDCSLVGGHTSTDAAIQIDINTGTTPTTTGLIIRRCVILGGVQILWDGNASADVNMKMAIENCLFFGQAQTSTARYTIFWDLVTADTFAAGGLDVTNCVFWGDYRGVYVEHGASTTYPIDVRNSSFMYCQTALNKQTSNDGALTSGYNTFLTCGTDYTNVSSGTNDRPTNNRGTQLFGGIGDFMLHAFWGWSPFRLFEPLVNADDTYTNNLIGDGDTAVAPATDMYNEVRPMYGTVDDRGPVEARARPKDESTNYRTAVSALRFEGTGFQDILLPVDAFSTTVTVYAEYDSNYSGTLPQFQVINIPGVADQTDTMVAAANTLEQLSVTFNPTSKGVARIRFVSNDTSVSGECFFDDLDVSLS